MSQPIKPTNKTHSTTALILVGSLPFFACPLARADLSADLAAAVDAPYLTFTTAGDAPWFVDTTTSVTGNSSIRSGDIGDSQSSSLTTTVIGPANLTFNWKVSSEGRYDYLRFNVDSTEQFNISGEVNWEQKTVSIPSGSHTLTWNYTKDGGSSPGADAGWVDNISLFNKMVAVGLYHTCAMKPDATLACWGDNSSGQATAPAGQFRNLTAGANHNCAIAFSDNTVICWGDNSAGQATAPTGTFSQLSAGEAYTCGIKLADSAITCWGDNGNGQTTAPSGTFTQLDAGDLHACAIKTDGTLACWGDNTAQQATAPSGAFKNISAGTTHSCGVKTDNTVTCWGDNSYQQSTAPSGSFKQVSAGEVHTCGIKTDNTVTCWGANFAGETVAPSGTFGYINANRYHTCGLKPDNSVVCWGGDNSFGQLDLQLTATKTGPGSGTVTSTPTGINCGTTCTANFSPLSTVTLTATPDSGALFGGWTSAACTNLTATTCNQFLDTPVTTLGVKFLKQSINDAPVLAAVPAHQRIVLNWPAVNGATSYDLFQGTATNGELITPIKTGLTGTITTVTGLTNDTAYYFKLQAKNASGVSPLSNEVTATPIAPPAAPVIRAVAGSCQVNLTWLAVTNATCYDIYQATSSGGQGATPVQSCVTGTSKILTPLGNGTRYYFKMKTQWQHSATVVDWSDFSNEVNAVPSGSNCLGPQIPTATTDAATAVSVTSATLNGKITPNNLVTTASFDLGTTTDYGTSVIATPASITATAPQTAITATKTNLNCNTLYHYRAKGVNSLGTGLGLDQTFTTGTCPIEFPVVTTAAASNVTQTSATLNGSVVSNGVAANVSFEFGTTTTYGATVTANPAQVYSATAVAVTAAKTGLVCGTTYYYRTKAVNSVGTDYGDDKDFTTAACNPNSWLTPPTSIVTRDRPFTLGVIAKSNGMLISSYQFVVTLDPTKLQFDTTYQNAAQTCYLGICPGTNALSNRSVLSANLSTGSLTLIGQDATGKGPGNDLQLLVMHLKTKTALGPTPVALVTNELSNPSGGSIGLVATGATVTVSPGLCGDADGNNLVNIVDALSVARKLVNLPPPPTIDTLLSDTNENARVDITDALFIARYSVGLVLPPEACKIGQPL